MNEARGCFNGILLGLVIWVVIFLLLNI